MNLRDCIGESFLAYIGNSDSGKYSQLDFDYCSDPDGMNFLVKYNSVMSMIYHYNSIIDRMNVWSVDSRLFTHSQRKYLYDRADGHCQECNSELKKSYYEYDHILPYSIGGRTSISNGQVLCLDCHNYKSKWDRFARKIYPFCIIKSDPYTYKITGEWVVLKNDWLQLFKNLDRSLHQKWKHFLNYSYSDVKHICLSNISNWIHSKKMKDYFGQWNIYKIDDD
jgi:nitrate reductase cytochrome c-type subunit